MNDHDLSVAHEELREALRRKKEGLVGFMVFCLIIAAFGIYHLFTLARA